MHIRGRGRTRRHRRPTLFALSAAAALAAAAGADVVVKDHVSVSSLWNDTARISNWDDTGSNIDFFGAAAFTGNGTDIVQVEGVFWSVSSTDVPNGALWANIDFRIIFYADINAFQTAPASGTQTVTLDAPDNADWLTPVATFIDPSDMQSYDLHRFTFNLAAQGIATAAGVEQLVAITPTGASLSDGETGVMFSDGGAGAVGAELDRWARLVPKTGPDTLANLGSPDHYLAYRVVLGDVPCPSDFNDSGATDVSDLLALLAAWGPCPGGCAADINGDEMVNVTDLLALLAAWGPCP